MQLKTDKAHLAYTSLNHACDMLAMLSSAEKAVPVNVHSHGKLIIDILNKIEAAQQLVVAFQSEVQGR